MNSRDYWAERARQDKIKVIKVGEKGIDNLKRLLKTNLDDVEKKIKEFYEKYGENPAEHLSYAEFEKYKQKLRAKAKKYPKDKTLQKLAKQDIPKYKIDRLRALETDLQIALTEATAGQETGIYKTLTDVGKVSQAVVASRFKKYLGLEFNTFSARKMKQLLSSDWSGANWSARLWKDREVVGQKLTNILEKGVTQGTSLQKMSRELKNVTGQSFNNAFRLIRTETSHIDGQVTLEGYKQAQKDFNQKLKYKYDAFLDNRTSKICRELEGKEFWVDDAKVGVNYPPMHPNCRSTTQLIIDDIDIFADEAGAANRQQDVIQKTKSQDKNEITPEILAQPYEDISQNDELIQKLKGQTKTLDETTQNSIKKYTTGWEGEYLQINGVLRNNLKDYEELTGVMTDKKITKVKNWIKDMDTAMDKSLLPQNMKLYRGVNENGLKTIFKNSEIAEFIRANEVNEINLAKVKNALQNARYDELGFMSTSYAKTSAYKAKTRFEINAPKNLKGILVEDIGINSEKEMLLQRNTSWIVKDITIEFDVNDRKYYYNFIFDYLSS
ncbi:MAG: minor capsid protein [Muribaculaceae bacterium]|nr:minor capsid protein [Muribaculaceae bacterium]